MDQLKQKQKQNNIEMESPPAPQPAPQSNQFRIRTCNLTYIIPKQVNWFWWEEVVASRCILKNVNCEAKPGEMMAIAGPSGAGKTTLLEILAGMVPLSRVSGDVLVNEQPMNVRQFRRSSGYVTQEEALFPLLTVEETLMYSARLRLFGGFDKAAGRVKDLLIELGLDHVADVRVGGDSNRAISGGEKRRVSIGVDLVHNPAVLLIDEPTSGLDSASAHHVVLLLKSMAVKQGKTIVLTIHQPGFRIFELFDQILLLSNGSVVHHGSRNLLEHRLRIAGHSIPRQISVLEFAIEVTHTLGIDTGESETESSDLQEEFDQIKNPDSDQITTTYYSNNPVNEIVILVQRFSSNICRTKQLFGARMLQSLLAGVVLGSIFMNATNLQTQIGFFAFTLTFLLSLTTEGLPIFLQERKILMRETSRGAYRMSSYVISNALVFLPFLLVVALLYSIPVYWLVGLRRELDGFLYFSLVIWLVVLMANSFVACFSALAPNFIVGNSLIAGVMGAYFLFSGYFIQQNDIPRYWIFMHYLSLFKYPFECFMINEYGGEQGKGRCIETLGGTCYVYADEFLMQQGLQESQKQSNVMVMLGFIVGYRLLCFLILWYRSYRNQC